MHVIERLSQRKEYLTPVPLSAASKFALIYNRKNPVTGEDNRSVAEIIEGNKSLTPGQRKDNAGQVGTDLFNTIAQGMSVRETILNEIKNQTLSLKPTPQTSGVEESVSEVFNENSQLAKIGTSAQYSAYLSTRNNTNKLTGVIIA